MNKKIKTHPKPKKPHVPSSLEKKFMDLWKKQNGPELVEEYHFHPTRKWRADFAHIESCTLIEIEGGVWGNGRHNRGIGMVKDAEKYLEAALGGWRVIRLTGPQIIEENVKRVIYALGCWSWKSYPRI